MIERKMVIRRIVDDTETSLDVLDRVFERKAEEAIMKLFSKVFDKKTMEELESRDLAHLLQEPVIFFEAGGETERVATSESDGRETAPGTLGEFDEEDEKLAGELQEKFTEEGLDVEVSPSGLVR